MFFQSIQASLLKTQFEQWKNLIQNSSYFKDYEDFIKKHPHWPRLNSLIQKAEERLLNESLSASKTLEWFENYPPQTVKGIIYYAHALLHNNNPAKARVWIRQCIREKNIETEKFKHMLTEFNNCIDEPLLFERASLRLNEEEIEQAYIIIPYLSSSHQDIIKARIALQEGDKAALEQADKCLVFAPNDIGILLDKVRYFRRNKEDLKAFQILRKKRPEEEQCAALFWKERNLIARRFFELKKFEQAYKLISCHALKEGEDYVNAQWLKGWILLIQKNQPLAALKTFENLYSKVKSPISVARVAFWAGESAKSALLEEKAKEWYEKASHYKGAFYGQLAQSKLTAYGNKTPLTHVEIESFVPSRQDRQNFEQQEFVKVIQSFFKTEEIHWIEPFYIKLREEMFNNSTHLKQLILLAYKTHGPAGAVKIAREAGKYIQLFLPQAYPLLSDALIRKIIKHTSKNPYLIYLVHAIIWRESGFYDYATSQAGAKGMMQLMDSTARQEIKRIKNNLGIKISSKENLYHTEKNILLGTSHLKYLLDKYNGHFVLAIAAYNAGESAVNEWIKVLGDPRHTKVNIVNWIELIPYAETRNYVHRVMEKFMVYLSRLKHLGAKFYDLEQFLNVPLGIH